MKTFTISAIAFYFFYVLNGLMAPTHAQRSASACTDAMSIQSGVKHGIPNHCKPDTLASQQIAVASPAN
jgi:uncharacterized membrane protein